MCVPVFDNFNDIYWSGCGDIKYGAPGPFVILQVNYLAQFKWKAVKMRLVKVHSSIILSVEWTDKTMKQWRAFNGARINENERDKLEMKLDLD